MKFYPAYSKNRPTFKASKGTPGVYLIMKDKQIQYIGYSADNVVKTAYRHFQRWNDPKQFRATFPKNARIAFIFTKSVKRAQQLERSLIIKHGFNKYGNLFNTYVPSNPFEIDDTPAPF